MVRSATQRFERRRVPLAACAAVALAAMAAGAALAAQPGAPGGVPGAGAAAQAPSGAYMNWFWLLLMFVGSAAWFYVTGWVSEDAAGVGMDERVWTGIFLGVGAFGILLVLLLHGALVFLLLAGLTGTFVFYVQKRNERVPENFRIFTRFGLGKGEGKPGMAVRAKGEAAEEGELTHGLGATVKNSSGQSLEEFVAQQPQMQEAATALAGILGEAIYQRARAIRVETGKEQFPVQFDMDEVLAQAMALERSVGQAALACIARFAGLGGKGKAVAKVSVSTKEGDTVEMTVKGIKTQAGPAIVLTLPDPTKDVYKGGLSALGMHEAMHERVKLLLTTPGTAALITGPPQSGRTCTIHAAIGEIDIFTTDVTVLEKKLVHEMDQVTRHEVDLDSPEKFEALFESVRREEPNVLMVDELTNLKIAPSLLEYAAGGGRLVATMQASSAAEAVERIALEVKGDLLSKSLTAVLNQRLIRRLCEQCREPMTPSPKLLAKLNIPPEEVGTWFKAVGCEKCMNTGYRGRTALYEMLVVSDEVRGVLAGGKATAASVRKAAGPKGIRTLQQDGLLKVRQGMTSFEELRRVLKQPEGGE